MDKRVAKLEAELRKLRLNGRPNDSNPGPSNRGAPRGRGRGGRRGRNNNPRPNARGLLPTGISGPARQVSQRGPGTGVVSITRKELFFTVKSTAGDTGSYKACTPINFSWLSGVAKAFERWRIKRLAITYHPLVATTTDGGFAMGFDYGDKTDLTKNALAHVMAQSPSIQVPLYQTAVLRLPNNIMSQKWYMIHSSNGTEPSDAYPGYLVWADTLADANKTLGTVWVDYEIQFMGTAAT